MKCLAVNTATKISSIALVEDSRVLHFYETAETRDQGNILVQKLLEILRVNSLNFKNIDLLSVVTGPGSFTGIRIGIATMRGIALAAEKPLIGVSSFDMFAAKAREEVNLIAVESWREELYFSVLDRQGKEIVPASNELPVELKNRLQLPDSKKIMIVGDAKEKMQTLFPDADVSTEEGNAADAAKIALQRYAEEGQDREGVLPYYLREADVTLPS